MIRLIIEYDGKVIFLYCLDGYNFKRISFRV